MHRQVRTTSQRRTQTKANLHGSISARPESGREKDPRELRRAGTGVDSAQSFRQITRTGRAKVGKKKPMRRPAQPDEIAPAFVFFASEADSSYITGKVLTLSGGKTTAA